MARYPNFLQYNYHIEQVLGKNSTGGRVTYLASHVDTQKTVVIKKYQFAKIGNWNSYQAHQSEIRVLRSLNLASIPRYLDSFETPNGFCLVQEYKQGQSLGQIKGLSPPEIKQVALNLLEILIYLQKHHPPIIHGDIKPDNILIDPDNGLKVYLIDFGFARMGSCDLGMSSSIRGTVGFMPPEEMFNRQLTTASDLYSLGATLVCLLTGSSAHNINQLLDPHGYQLHYQHLLLHLHPRFRRWLRKMTAPKQSDRFADALTAYQALKSLSIEKKTSFFLYRPILKKYSLKSIILGITILVALALAGMTGFMYWQGRTVRLLLTSKNCEGCYLRHLTLRQGNLIGVKLAQANLKDSNLKDSNLANADLRRVNLSNAYLKGVTLTGANLEGAILKGVNLMEANLEGANLEGANLEGAILNGANLTQTNFKFANLLNAKLKYTRLIKSNLEGANLGGANMEGANLENTILPDSNFSQ
ncbi:serine/threonine-protein kinase [Crocosphaera chwakensis]|uniref:non-specific serine/threonine protein kinase n=1 Tax=Crocosphaera chwakensis CCY0110 TaxID=391612 RepID=A3IZG6_9CHRO|nr:serine/threonine-protein kinase [Crocosphaera chwakensis]EAZ88129.1 serine/threonine kinase [Crocosphaera chwakensis CCY0110]